MSRFIIQTASGGVELILRQEELALPLSALRSRVFDPCRSAFRARFPAEVNEYDTQEAALIEKLGLR